MNPKPLPRTSPLLAKKRLNGLIYGALAGFVFALAAWGWDAYELAVAGAILPWAKFASSVLATILLGMLVGGLAARMNNTLVSAFLWLVAGIVFTILAGTLPNLRISLIQHWLALEIAGYTNYPIIDAAQIRLWVALLVAALSSFFIGAFELTLINMATISNSRSIRWLSMGACIPLAFIGGYIGVDTQINQPLRAVVISGDSALEIVPVEYSQPSAIKTPVLPLTMDQPILPTAEKEVQSLIDLPSYQISADLDFENHSFDGQMQLSYFNTENTPLESLFFRLFPNGGSSYGNGSLTVHQVEVNDQQVETSLSLNDSALEVTLPEPVQPGSLIKISLDFYGVVPVDYGGPNTTGYGIYNFSQNVMALSGWFPILAVYNDEGWNLDPISGIGDSVFSDMANFNVQINVPKNVILVSTGITTDLEEVSPDLTQYTIESGPARDFFLILSPDFQVYSHKVGATQVNSYYLPGNDLGAEQVLSVGSDSLRIYDQQFGQYPYVDLDLVDAPMRYASGVEFPGIVLIGDSLYSNYTAPDLTVTTAHEVAHQWWYNLVGNDVIDDPWLDEALATYSSSLYYEFTNASSAAQGLFSYYENRYQRAVEAGKDDQITRSETYFEGLNDSGRYGAIVYAKGALFFQDLRHEIGDKAFFRALRDYFNSYKYKIASPSDLLNAFEVTAGRPLADFYQAWLYSPE